MVLSLDVMTAMAGIQGSEGMDTGVRRYDGCFICLFVAQTVLHIFSKEDTKRTKFGVLFIRTLRVLRDFRGEFVSTFPRWLTEADGRCYSPIVRQVQKGFGNAQRRQVYYFGNPRRGGEVDDQPAGETQ